MHASRSHTDALTNLVVLSALDIGRHFPEILDRDLPIATLPTFLHEATHHWCFDTPVGLALHLLFIRARRAALARIGDPWRLLDAVVRYEMARDFIHPLSEGLALFAEHDAIPGRARTISTPMSKAAALYARGLGAIDGELPYGELPIVLAGARVSWSHTRRKAALLLEPLSCAKGGYLPGYMLVKVLWRYARQQSELFHDADFFLQYLRAHLFDDWGLVARLLDDERKDISAIDPILGHVAGRMQNFIEVAVRGDRPRRFEDAGAENQFELLQIRTKLLHTGIRFHRIEDDPGLDLGRKRLHDEFASQFAEWTGDPISDALLNADLTELNERSIVNLGHMAVDGEPAPQGLRLSKDGELLATVPAAGYPELAGVAGPLDLELLSLESPGGLCMTLRQSGRLLGSLPIGSTNLPDELKKTLSSREERAQRARWSYDLIDGALTKADLHDTLGVVRNTLKRRLEEWLIPLALNYVPDDRVPAVQARMREDGFLDIFGRDKALLLDAAVASLCIPSPYTFESVAAFHQWSEPTPQHAILRIAEAVSGELGFPAFAVEESGHFEKVSFI